MKASAQRFAVNAVVFATALLTALNSKGEEPRSTLSTALSSTVISGSISTTTLVSLGGGPTTARVQISPFGVRATLSEFSYAPSVVHLNGPLLGRSIYYLPVSAGLNASLGDLMQMDPQAARLAIESLYPMSADRTFVGYLGGLQRVNSQSFGGGVGAGYALGYAVRSGTGQDGMFTQVINRPGGAFQGYDVLAYRPTVPVGYAGSNVNSSAVLNGLGLHTLGSTITLGGSTRSSLILQNWSGNFTLSSGTNDTGLLQFSSAGLTANQLGQIRFYSDSGTTFTNFGTFVGTEIVPVAELSQINLIVAGPVVVPEPAAMMLLWFVTIILGALRLRHRY
jgi:hypothetical protein